MKKKLFLINSIFNCLLIGLIPILRILVDVENIKTNAFSVFIVLYIVLLIILSFISLFEIIIIVKKLMKKEKFLDKILNFIILIFLNLIVLPYYYKKEVLKEKNNKKYLFYILYILILIAIFFSFNHVYNNSLIKLEEKNKELSEIYNNYSTIDNFVSFKFKYGFRVSKVNEYDLYVKDSDRNLVFTVFNYDINNYEEKTHEEFLNKSVNDLKGSKDEFSEFEETKTTTLEDRVITKVSYVGKTKNSSLCVYNIYLITFNSHPNNLVYITEISIKDKYNLYKEELENIVLSAKIN